MHRKPQRIPFRIVDIFRQDLFEIASAAARALDKPPMIFGPAGRHYPAVFQLLTDESFDMNARWHVCYADGPAADKDNPADLASSRRVNIPQDFAL